MSETVEAKKALSNDIPRSEITTVADFLHRLSESFDGKDGVLFRGQSDERWQLLPRLARMKIRAKFLPSYREVERKMLSDFERLAVIRVRSRQLNDQWNILALAQHHGLPTRLLDWSSNPLVALWFAVRSPSTSDAPAVVWVFDAPEDDYVDQVENPIPAELSTTKVFRPHHHDERIVAQAGWFTVHRYSEGRNRFTSFEHIEEHRERLSKYFVAPRNFPAIREELARCGITHASLFPDLAGLCQHLNWKYEMLSDEADRDISTFF